MMMQKTITTVVDPIVSARLGNDTFFSSPRTSLRNSRIELKKFLNMPTSPLHATERTPTHLVPVCYQICSSTDLLEPDPSTTQSLAGALGFEPRLSVLETDVLPLTPCPYRRPATQPVNRRPSLFHFLMGNVLPTELAELIPLQAIRVILFIFHGGIVPLLADRACQINNLTHLNTPMPSCDSSQIYARISVTTPEPTVLPPSRTANRNPRSIAIGLINSPVTLTLSP